MAEKGVNRILQIGAGGIGCELLKLLVMSGFDNITVLDLDNIDVSNLNRQFLFRRCHVGQPKAKVAAEVVSHYRPGVTVTPIQAPVQSFGPEFFQDFALVFNALDNNEARRHVNRICAYLKKPMIEAGTQGFLGQVSVHFPPVSACFECEEKAAPKTYAVCTIRSTPDKPVHCVVWGKYLYEALFGHKEESNMLSEVTFETAKELTARLFCTEIAESKANVPKRVLDEGDAEVQNTLRAFTEAVSLCAARPRVPFEKEDEVAMQFVWSASSLRSYNFFIPLISLFDCKQIAGNIIPAVASTNGIAAGIQVAEAIKFLKGHSLAFMSVWISEMKASNDKLILAGKMPPSIPGCIVCGGSVMKLELKLDVTQFTLGKVVSRVLRAELSMHSPTICFGESMLYETGADLDEDSIEMYETLSRKPLQEFGVGTDSVLVCDVRDMQDFSQKYKVELWVKHNVDVDELQVVGRQHPDMYVLSGSREVSKSTDALPTTSSLDDSDFEILAPVKRQRTETGNSEGVSKRGKWEDAEDVVDVD